NAVLDGCTLVGEPAVVSGSGPYTIVDAARTALSVDAGTAQSLGSAISGGFAWNLGAAFTAPAPGIDLGPTADLRLLSGTVAAGSPTTSPLQPAITGYASSALRIDPTVVITSYAPAPVQGPSARILGMPTLTARDGAIGGSIAAAALAPAGDMVALLVGF